MHGSGEVAVVVRVGEGQLSTDRCGGRHPQVRIQRCGPHDDPGVEQIIGIEGLLDRGL